MCRSMSHLNRHQEQKARLQCSSLQNYIYPAILYLQAALSSLLSAQLHLLLPLDCLQCCITLRQSWSARLVSAGFPESTPECHMSG